MKRESEERSGGLNSVCAWCVLRIKLPSNATLTAVASTRNWLRIRKASSLPARKNRMPLPLVSFDRADVVGYSLFTPVEKLSQPSHLPCTASRGSAVVPTIKHPTYFLQNIRQIRRDVSAFLLTSSQTRHQIYACIRRLPCTYKWEYTLI